MDDNEQEQKRAALLKYMESIDKGSPTLDKQIGDNLQALGDQQKTLTSQGLDRLRMSNSDQQGPRLPFMTPEEKDNQEHNMGFAMGSIQAPAGSFGKVADIVSPKLNQAQQLLNGVEKAAATGEGGMTLDTVKAAMQQRNRLLDQKEAMLQALKNRKFNR